MGNYRPGLVVLHSGATRACRRMASLAGSYKKDEVDHIELDDARESLSETLF
jgi:hypothetical protein